MKVSLKNLESGKWTSQMYISLYLLLDENYDVQLIKELRKLNINNTINNLINKKWSITLFLEFLDLLLKN